MIVIKRYKDFYKINENMADMTFHQGDFKVTKDMVKDGEMIKECIPDVIEGNFFCNFLNLTTLKNSPFEVRKDFRAVKNELTDLRYLPQRIYGDLMLMNNKITSLEGCPKEVDGDFYCSTNKLTSLEGGPEKVKGVYFCNYNKLTSLEYCAKHVGDELVYKDNESILDIEADFIKSGNFKNNYYKDLFDYLISKKIDLKEIESWPDGFFTKNLKNSLKGNADFNL